MNFDELLYKPGNGLGLGLPPRLDLNVEHMGSSAWHTYIGNQRHEVYAPSLTGNITKLELSEGTFKNDKVYRLRIYLKADRQYGIISGLKTVFSIGLLSLLLEAGEKAKSKVTISVIANNPEQNNGTPVVFAGLNINGFDYYSEIKPSDVNEHQAREMFGKVEALFGGKSTPAGMPQDRVEAMKRELEKLGYGAITHLALAEQATGRKVSSLADLSEQEALSTWAYAKRKATQTPTKPGLREPVEGTLPWEALEQG